MQMNRSVKIFMLYILSLLSSCITPVVIKEECVALGLFYHNDTEGINSHALHNHGIGILNDPDGTAIGYIKKTRVTVQKNALYEDNECTITTGTESIKFANRILNANPEPQGGLHE